MKSKIHEHLLKTNSTLVSKKLLPLLLLLFAGMANAQIVNIPDANFKAKLISSNFDINSDGEIQVSEVQSATYLDVSQSNITDMTGIEAFTSLTNLICFGNHITALNVSNSPNLQILYCNENQLATLDISGLTNIQTLNCNNNNLNSLDVSSMIGLTYLSCNRNQITSLNISGLTSLTYLDCFLNQISSLDINSSTNLNDLNCSYNQITLLNITNLTNLVNLNCSGNQLTSLNVNTLTALQKLLCNNNYLTSLDTTTLTNLIELDCGYNQLSSITLSGSVNLEILRCGFNTISTLNLTGLNNLKHLDFEHCQITSVNLTNLTSLEILNAYNNQLTSLNVNNLINLKNLSCSGIGLTSLNVTSLINLESLVCSFSSITTLNTSNSPNLKSLICVQNQLTSLNLSNNNNLEYLDCSINQLASLDVTNLTLLKVLRYGNNFLPNVNFSGLTQLYHLALDTTGRTSLDVSNQPLLRILYCNSNLIPVIDVSMSSQLKELVCGGSNLSQILMKNGSIETYFNIIVGSPSLQFVCGDEGDLSQIQNAIAASGSPAVATSYCTFVPGGDYNTINGVITFDNDNDGCDASDPTQPNIKVKLGMPIDFGYSFSNTTGNYAFYTDAGGFMWMLDVENPSWFTFTPATASTLFADNNNNIVTQNFCLAPNGNHKDVEMVIMPIGAARPGFDATYKLVYKNKGNQTVDAFLNFSYNDTLLDFVSSSVVPTGTSSGHLSWTVMGLQPFQSGSVLITLNLSPASNIGDILTFTSFIDITTDENWSDNTFTLDQTVVGSYDPNAITCLEGDSLPVIEIGKYLHYGITFENTGNYAAENVVVKDVIDINKYDINSLQVLGTSHPSNIKITGNTVEFVFQDIQLTAASGTPPVGGHGDVLFKIKSKNSLVNGDYVSKTAKIYFDYNAPITTNDAETTFATLNNPIHEFDDSVKIYPNPAHNLVNISCNSTIQSVSLYDIQGRLLETDLSNGNEASFDISGKSNGVYFIKITSDKGSKVEKIVKE